MKINSIIVDDEKHGRENLEGILRDYCPGIEITGEADSVEAAISLIRERPPDLIFLDIQMPRANGFKLLEQLRDINFEVIFVTAYDSYAIKAIRFSAADYILKPINRYELIAAVEKVTERIRQKQKNERLKLLYHNLNQPDSPRIGLPAGDRIKFVDVNSIYRCQGEGNYTRIFFESNNHLLVSKTLYEFEELLQEFSFVRVHKAHLVNMNYVIAYIRSECSLKLSNGELIQVSRRRKEEVMIKLKSC